jgi:FkbM family methyltransferase
MYSNLIGVESVWVYGSGTFAQDLIEKIAASGISLAGVLDHRNTGIKLNTSIGSFEVLELKPGLVDKNSAIVLAVCNLHGDLHAISNNLNVVYPDARLISPVGIYLFFQEMGFQMNNYWLTTDFDLYRREAEKIQEFRETLSDSQSQLLFDAIIKYRKFGDVQELPLPLPLIYQYLADDLLTPPAELRIIDLGACQGENLEYFLAADRLFVEGFLLEPDVHNFEILEKKLKQMDLHTLKPVRAGAWNHSGVLKFDSTGNAAASFSESGAVEIEVVALDDFITSDFNPNFVKMDIEGAEFNALLGMAKLIERNRPHLAISAYHRPEDLWALGNYLSQTYPGVYKYSLRMYGHQSFDTILYAVPTKD